MTSQSWQQAEFTVSALYYRRVCEVLHCLEVRPFQKTPLSIWDVKQFRWNTVWETVLQNQHTDPLQCPSFWQHYHKTLEKNNFLVVLSLASNKTQSYVYFVFWERHWYWSLRKLTSQKTEIIPSILNLLSQDLWTTLYYFTVQKCFKGLQAFHWTTRNRHSFPKSSNIYVPNIA